jgi:hypothetical protein
VAACTLKKELKKRSGDQGVPDGTMKVCPGPWGDQSFCLIFDSVSAMNRTPSRNL